MSGTDIPVGDIRFYDSYVPPLLADDYTLTVSQEIAGGGQTLAAKTATQPFTVVAPRFAVDSSEVQSMFPPNNVEGPFGNKLPHVVLTQRALPWERELASDLPASANPNIKKAYPWLALLVLTEDEIVSPAGGAGALANPTKATTRPVGELLKPDPASDPNVLGPAVQPELADETTCRTIDISTATFTEVAPQLVDLPYLAHVRQVAVDNKSSAELAGGWFSVVIANRFPVVGTAAEGKRNIAHLVSLEGFADYVAEDEPAWPAGKDMVRLCSLASWAFSVRAEGLDFKALMTGLTEVAGQPSGSDALRLRLPVPPPPDPAPDPAGAEGKVRTAIAQGFTALAYETRVGDQSFAWYHGPLVPRPVAPIGQGSFASSAGASIYDKDSGTFDLSYASAWEIGRLLALSDRAYSTAQQRARRALRKTVNLARERTRWTNEAPAGADPGLLHPRQVSRSFASWLGSAGPGHLPSPTADARAPAAKPAPPAQAGHVDGLSAMLAEPAVQSLVQDAVGATTGDGAFKEIVGWLGRLRLLEGVPFVYLVPDARMLPVESIRFFHVDPNALDALCDGAQSVGVHTSRDALHQQMVRDSVRTAATVAAASRRAASLGRSVADDAPPVDPVAGFLLRSAVVSGWPGLEVKAYADAAGQIPIDPLRIDHLASDVLIALYPSVPARIDIEEPKESLAFGTEDDWIVALRSIAGDDIGGQIGQPQTLGPDYRKDNGVLRVDAWQRFLASLDPFNSGAPAALWGPAAFAMQMISAPEQMVFDNGSKA
jgi:hypothetical protein